MKTAAPRGTLPGKEGKGVLISGKNAVIVNQNDTEFHNRINCIVSSGIYKSSSDML